MTRVIMELMGVSNFDRIRAPLKPRAMGGFTTDGIQVDIVGHCIASSGKIN